MNYGHLWATKGTSSGVWSALDTNTREIVGVYIGARDEGSARKLWESLPPVYRQCAIAYTDFWAAYGAVLRPQTTSSRRQRHWKNQLPKSDLTIP